MKKIILIFIIAIAIISSHQTIMAQVTLEHTYDSAALNLYMVHLEIDGDKYIRTGVPNNTFNLYNLDHSLFKSFDYSNIPNLYNIRGFLYVSQHLFNLDSLIECLIVNLDVNSVYHTYIINELGTILFTADSLVPLIAANIPQVNVPIYNTSNGTKMILSTFSNQVNYANVYSLTGTLTNSIKPITFDNGNQLSMENIYPNPSNGNTTIEFNLPQGVSTGQLVIYNNQGVELKKYKVDNTFHTLLLNNSEFHAGTYFYQLQTAGGVSGAKKMIVIH